jgi:DNA-binding NarL/FixJ family response regulator
VVTAAILTDDVLAGDAVQGYLRTATGIRLAAQDQMEAADVIVVITATLTEQLLDRMKQAQQATVATRQCMVLISHPPTERFLALAFRYGVVSIVPRGAATRGSIVAAVLASANGSAVLPGPAARWLADASRDFQEIAQAAHGISSGGLTAREVDVVRLVALGLPTNEIAARLNYAERTIKNIIRDMLDRHQLHNRAHAVAYAYRTGAI